MWAENNSPETPLVHRGGDGLSRGSGRRWGGLGVRPAPRSTPARPPPPRAPGARQTEVRLPCPPSQGPGRCLLEPPNPPPATLVPGVAQQRRARPATLTLRAAAGTCGSGISDGWDPAAVHLKPREFGPRGPPPHGLPAPRLAGGAGGRGLREGRSRHLGRFAPNRAGQTRGWELRREAAEGPGSRVTSRPRSRARHVVHASSLRGCRRLLRPPAGPPRPAGWAGAARRAMPGRHLQARRVGNAEPAGGASPRLREEQRGGGRVGRQFPHHWPEGGCRRVLPRRSPRPSQACLKTHGKELFTREFDSTEGRGATFTSPFWIMDCLPQRALPEHPFKKFLLMTFTSVMFTSTCI